MARIGVNQDGLLIVGHGTRSARGQEEFREVAELVSRLIPCVSVEACYLELADPTIEAGLARLQARGNRRIVVLPLLLFAAGHAKQDIPNAVAAAARAYPEIELTFAEHLGCHERLLRLSARQYLSSQVASEIDACDTLWLFVGRGSHDASALAEMEQFAERRLQLTPVGRSRLAYLAMATPRFVEVLAEVAELRFRRVVVQPHLLFHGELLETVERQVAAMAARWPDQEWLVAPRLGAARLLAEVIAERYEEAKCGSPLGR